MTFLLGAYTSTVLQWLSLSASWILYIGFTLSVIGGIVVVSRTAIYKRSKEIDIHIRPASVEVIGILLLFIGLAIAAPGADALSQPVYVGGGPAFQPCPAPFQNLPCYQSGGAGITSLSQKGSTSCTVTVGNTGCTTTTTTFSPAFATRPFLFYNYTQSTSPQGNGQTADVNGVLMFQGVNSTTWTNMTSHDNPSDLYNQPNQEIDFVIHTTNQGGNTLSVQLCVDVVEPSQNASATLSVQANGVDIWGTNGYANVGGVAGISCGGLVAPTFNFVAGTEYTFKVVGRDGASNFFCTPTCATNPKCAQNNVGVGTGTNVDCPQFGTIELFYTYALNVPEAAQCALAILSLSTTAVRFIETCFPALTNTVTFTIQWTAGVTV